MRSNEYVMHCIELIGNIFLYNPVLPSKFQLGIHKRLGCFVLATAKEPVYGGLLCTDF